MSASTTLLTFASLQNDTSATSDLNNNFAAINTALTSCLSITGQAPNQMQSNLDMNSNRVLNLPAPLSISEPMRLADATTLNGGGTVTVSQLPVAGTTGQVLTKISNTNFDVGWSTPTVALTVGKTFTVLNTLTLAGTDGTTITFQGTDTYISRSSTDSLSNKTFNAGALGNSLLIGGVVVTGSSGTGALVFQTSPTISSPTFTGTVGGTPTFSGLNFLTLSNLPTFAPYSLLGNTSAGTVSPQVFTIGSLTQKASPTAGDYVMIQDNAASGQIKYATVSSVGSAGSVSSIAGNTGAFTLGAGLTNQTNSILQDASYRRGYLAGLNLSGGGSQVLTISAGSSTSDDNSTLMKLSSTYTKAVQTAWAVGSGNGSLDTGAIAASTWYHVFQIERTDTGVVDVLTSISATTPTMPTNYTVKRRIGSFKTDGSNNILAFTQNGDEFLWNAVAADDIVGPIGTTATLVAMNVPTGVKVNALFNAQMSNATISTSLLFSSPDAAVAVANSPAGNVSLMNSVTNQFVGGQFNIRTNTSAQIRYVATVASTSVHGGAYGWVDLRGKFT